MIVTLPGCHLDESDSWEVCGASHDGLLDVDLELGRDRAVDQEVDRRVDQQEEVGHRLDHGGEFSLHLSHYTFIHYLCIHQPLGGVVVVVVLDAGHGIVDKEHSYHSQDRSGKRHFTR